MVVEKGILRLSRLSKDDCLIASYIGQKIRYDEKLLLNDNQV